MADTGFDDFPSDDTPPEEGNNRTFLIVAGILGGIILITAACLGGVLLLNRGNTPAVDPAAQTATAQAQNNVINDALTATFQASILPTTTLTPAPTATSVVAVASATPTLDPAQSNAPLTATIAAALTQAAAAQLTIVPTTTALPNTGFMDDYGLPGMFVMAVAFVIVILLARRLRVSPVSNR
jgi:hypothetical protein